MMLRVEMTAEDANEHHGQHDRADRHMKPMEPGEHEERRAVDTCRQLEVELAVCVAVLESLETKEAESQDNGDEQPELERATIAHLQRVMRDGKRATRGHENDRIQQR